MKLFLLICFILPFQLSDLCAQENIVYANDFSPAGKITTRLKISEQDALEMILSNSYVSEILSRTYENENAKNELLVLDSPDEESPTYDLLLCKTQIIGEAKYMVPMTTFTVNAKSGKAFGIKKSILGPKNVTLKNWRP